MDFKCFCCIVVFAMYVTNIMSYSINQTNYKKEPGITSKIVPDKGENSGTNSDSHKETSYKLNITNGINGRNTRNINNYVTEWHYIDENEWCANVSMNCCGDDQSPIDINIKAATYDKYGDCLLLQNYGCMPTALTENNIQHTMQLLYEQDNKTKEANVVYDGQKYVFDRAVFHFGEDSSSGSEHTVNSVVYPMEMQMVHRSVKYATIDDAKTKSDGLLNIAVLFVTANEDNDDLRGLIYDIHYVIFKDDYYSIKPFPISMLMPRPYGLYYSYKGSITVPPCYESVRWLVFHNIVPISEFQLDQFRKLQHNTKDSCLTAECPMWNNYRKVDSHKDRHIKWKEECNPI